MIEVDLKFKILRVNLRRDGQNIAEDVFKRHHPATKSKDEICVFCNSTTSITKEHVLPKWLLENNLQETMTSSVNKQLVAYNKAVVPACSVCNNSVLAPIEKYVIKVADSD